MAKLPSDSPRRRHVLGEQVQWIAELAARTIESVHDRARIDTRLARVLWLIGWLGFNLLGAFIHILVVIAVIIFVIALVKKV